MRTFGQFPPTLPAVTVKAWRPESSRATTRQSLNSDRPWCHEPLEITAENSILTRPTSTRHTIFFRCTTTVFGTSDDRNRRTPALRRLGEVAASAVHERPGSRALDVTKIPEAAATNGM